MKAAAFALSLFLALPAAAQSVDVVGLNGRAHQFSESELASMPRDHVKLKSHDGATTIYEGPPLTQLLKRVGAPAGSALRVADMSTVVLVSAKDGYQVALALAETDASIGANSIILADRADGKPLGATEGPLRLIVGGDLRPARSARMVTSIHLVRIRPSDSPR